MLCAIVGAASAHAERFVEITAEIELISYQALNTNGVPEERHRTYPLKCVVGLNEWRIDNEFPLNGIEHWYFDGTNVYSSTQITKDMQWAIPQRPGMPTLVPFSRAKENLSIRIAPSPGGHPIGNLGVNVPWLAFCSGTYLKQPGRVVPLPTTDIRESPDGLAYKDAVQTFEDAFGLPRSVELFTSREQYRASLTDSRLGRNPGAQKERLNLGNSNIPDGKLKFKYVVEESTNFFDWSFPTRFTYESYQSDVGGNWQQFVGGKGRVLSICEGTKPQNVFEPDRKQTIVDYRFRSGERPVDAIVYNVANVDSALSTNNYALKTNYAQMLKRARTAAVVSSTKWWAVVCGALCVPLLYWLLTRGTSGKDQAGKS